MSTIVIEALVKIGVVLGGVLGLTVLLTWQERKQSAVMQDRIGANRASIFGLRIIGLFHPIADSLKMLTKETFIPANAHKLLYLISPMIAAGFAMISFAAVPFGDYLYLDGRGIPLRIVDLNVGLLFVFAMMSMSIYGIFLAGWSSNNNFAFLGGMRACSQMISYEITMGATVVGIVMMFHTVDLNEIVRAQGVLLWGWLPKWGVLLQPLGFLLFLVAAIAETKRVPFDLPEGESEIIGYFLEYSGMRFGLFMMTDFIETILISALITTLFFGGWQVPYLHTGAEFNGFAFPWGTTWVLSHYAAVALQVLAYAVKVYLFCWFCLLVRWTLPRFRYDQLMRLGWKFMLPLSLANIAVTGLIILAVRASRAVIP
jgi:NADH-quinone oxidoreductase subunit H